MLHLCINVVELFEKTINEVVKISYKKMKTK